MVYQGEQTSLFLLGEQIECLVYILSVLIKACSVSQITVGCTELQTSLEKCTSLRSCSCLISLSPQRAQSYPQSWYAYRSIIYICLCMYGSRPCHTYTHLSGSAGLPIQGTGRCCMEAILPESAMRLHASQMVNVTSLSLWRRVRGRLL